MPEPCYSIFQVVAIFGESCRVCRPMTYTVLAASISKDFLGRFFLHIDTMCSDEATIPCGRAFNTTKNRVTTKPMLSVGDARATAVEVFQNSSLARYKTVTVLGAPRREVLLRTEV